MRCGGTTAIDGAADDGRRDEIGMRAMNVAPCFGPALWAVIVPPWSSTRCLVIDKPSPSPYADRVVDASC